MIVLIDSSSALRLTTTTAEAVDVAVRYQEHTGGSWIEGTAQATISSATTTQVLDPSAEDAAQPRVVRNIAVRNRGSGAQTVTLLLTRSAVDYLMTPAVSLAAGWSLNVDAEGRLNVYDDAGLLQSGASGGGGGDALTTDPISQFAATTSAQLAGVISDETGSGALVFANSPTLVTPALGTPASGALANCTGLPVTTGLSAGNWKIIYTNGSGAAIELALGSVGQYLMANGASSAPSFETGWRRKLKTTTETITNDATISNDSELVIALAASTKYAIRAIVFLNAANATMDYQFGTAYSGTTTGTPQSFFRAFRAGSASGTDNEVVGFAAGQIPATGITAATSGTGHVLIEQVIETNSAGNWSIQWAQNTSDAGALSVYFGSFIEYMVIA